MALSAEESKLLSAICNKHFDMSKENCGCSSCLLHSVCEIPTPDFAGATLEEKQRSLNVSCCPW